MNKWLNNWSVSAKLRVLAASGILALLAFAGWQMWESYQQGYEARKHATQNAVETAMGVVKWAQAQETSGKLSREAAQELAKSTLSTMRYSGSEYFWINDMTPNVVMHPIKPELNGKNASGIKDPQGNALFVMFADMVKHNNQGFVPYLWPKPGSAEPVQKLSYVQGFAPWGWVIGSGIYIDDLKAQMVSQLKQLLLAVVAIVALLAALTHVISSAILGRLKTSTRFARAIADGDISQNLDVSGKDEISQLMAAMNDMISNLRTLVGSVQQSSLSVENSAGEIAQGNADLANRTEQQASALEETAASMEELASTVRQTADNAAQGNQLAMGASTIAVRGGEVVDQVIGTMKNINDSSKKIADIISVIDGIAFQTNILALNAAVEAARAGEQGRGFAVVATEVRNLAQRSAAAAKEIKTLINNSVEQVEQGSTLVATAGSTMIEVVTAIRRVTDIMGEISSASNEQSMGVAQVCEAVTQMDQVTQQNAALVEESAAAAESLKTQAEALVHSVAVFKLADSDNLAADHPAWSGNERRGPHRANNVTRPSFNQPRGSQTQSSNRAAPEVRRNGTNG